MQDLDTEVEGRVGREPKAGPSRPQEATGGQRRPEEGREGETAAPPGLSNRVTLELQAQSVVEASRTGSSWQPGTGRVWQMAAAMGPDEDQRIRSREDQRMTATPQTSRLQRAERGRVRGVALSPCWTLNHLGMETAGNGVIGGIAARVLVIEAGQDGGVAAGSWQLAGVTKYCRWASVCPLMNSRLMVPLL